MDGQQNPVSQSLQFRLSLWVSIVILSITIFAGVGSYLTALQEANELQDELLQQMASLINAQNAFITQTDNKDHYEEEDIDDRILVQQLNHKKSSPAQTNTVLTYLPENLADGIQTINVHNQSWRVFVKTVDPHIRVAICQQTAVRDEVAQDSALRTTMPLLILIPILLLLLNYMIRTLLQPMKKIAESIDGRTENNLLPISKTNVPTEIRPFIGAINRLLSKVARQLADQQRFVADAAHELRSPLTALSLQVEKLKAIKMPVAATTHLAHLDQGMTRVRNLLDQMLMLARVQNADKPTATMVSIKNTFREVLEDLMPLAQNKNIDVGVTTDKEIFIHTDPMDLRLLVKNLVDNAIRYTQKNGQVNLSASESYDEYILQIDDTGPGIVESERSRIFDPFYRILGNGETGSGLGLSIVQTVVHRMSARIILNYTNESIKYGLRVQVIIPKTKTLRANLP